jgi:hypothetical protein
MSKNYINKGGVKVRKIPYPYESMMAICSDLDETPSKEVYFEIMRFLNTEKESLIGAGVGLEVGNTIYFDMPNEQFSYWNTDDEGRERIRKLIKAGFIDCIHSFGDYAVDRSHAEHALKELEKNKCFIKVWVDHAQAITNLGEDIMQGCGCIPGHAAYHNDLLMQYGIKYVWRGRVTSVLGQQVKRSYAGIADVKNYRSVVTLVKQIIKDLAGLLGNKKYRIHGTNKLLKDVTLRDGACVTEFVRCNPYWGGVDLAATANGIAEVLTERYLNRLVKSGGMSILYTHLGKITELDTLFTNSTREAFLRLKSYSDTKKILVCTTARLLDYCKMVHDISISYIEKKGVKVINIDNEIDVNLLQGLTFKSKTSIPHVLNCKNRKIDLVELRDLKSGELFYMVPWEKLTYPI